MQTKSHLGYVKITCLPLMMKGHSGFYELLDEQRRCEPKAGRW